MTRDELIFNLNTICDEANSHDNGYHYEANVNNWNGGNKSRTYFSITETRDNTKHYAKKDYGYIDNVTGEYYGRKGSHLDGVMFTFSGAKL